MKTLEIKVEKVTQPIGEFYIAQIDSEILYSMAKADIMRISNKADTIYEGIQRELDLRKVDKIKKYLQSNDATFPNSIILNLNKESLLELKESTLKIKVDKESFSIIDGQHRLAGLKGYNGKFSLSCSIFIGLDKSEQSRIFVTINSEQTKVNPSVSVYQEYEDSILTPRKFAAEIAVAFATDKKSKWYNQIKLRGFKDEFSEEGIISLSAFYKPILDLIYDDDLYFEVRNLLCEDVNNPSIFKNYLEYYTKFSGSEKYILWDVYVEYKKELLYKILNNYFDSLSEVLYKDWESGDKSIIKKTTGYNALMLLFKDLFVIGFENGTLSKDFFDNYLSKLKILNGKINASNFESSGQQSAKNLYLNFKELIF
ncbi:DGQHR domain-containing protein [Lysinibacillus sp. 1P01SD]|uniref:DGQHR domain-containing protein n=1 Tax=Lysinibacillus sp. 1P01SD TaxID=3132285 RepID=UPI0039A268A3